MPDRSPQDAQDRDAARHPPGDVGLNFTLGRRTDRGFRLLMFQDPHGVVCQLQESSLALYETPGSSALWLRFHESGAPGSGPGRDAHLTRRGVQDLVKALEAWLRDGRLPTSKEHLV